MRVLVTGAASQIGHYLVPMLVAGGHECLCVSRRPHGDSAGIRWIVDDLRYPRRIFAPGTTYDAWINLASLEFVPALLDLAMAAGIERLIAFGTTSIFTKRVHGTPSEQAFIRRIMDAEAEIADRCDGSALAWTVFRPTLIYSGMDRNVSFIARIIRRFRVFPLLGDGRRQPVHAEDLAAACVRVLADPCAAGKAYNLGGGEVLPYTEMIRRVFDGLGLRPRFVRIPLSAARLGIGLVRRLPGYGYLTTAMIDRTADDMVFDIAEAVADFGFAPRPFVVPAELVAGDPTRRHAR